MAAIAPIGAFARFVITYGTAAWANWEALSGQFDRAEEQPIDVYGMYSHAVFQMRTPAGAFDDSNRGMFGTHWVNTTGGALDTSWDQQDFEAISNGLWDFFADAALAIPSSMRLSEVRLYPFGPGVVKPNPPSYTHVVSPPKAGTGSNVGPFQMACSVTLRTVLRRHWGRFYVPATAQMTSSGLFSTGLVDNVTSAAEKLLTDGYPAARGIYPVVWDRVRKTAFGVTEIAVDDVPDIIRRRRPPYGVYKRVLDGIE